ncbi:glycine cleavage system T protein [Oceaniovalibus guishaninsula JLT2003]|uniref:aminomethyltransferase n=1 Tax=Oceaniovalibus guishaninsula JLT2003 TaxID=1231392 RepID=K2HLZ5_9RHOB|nr:glycine cleavage system aminomethyltransferase GcvT [Oceaniovalibus guishaninsula]EKE43909.1 glycine cleavage system T protein [Oceaniovalibus guishaninsula JLT2003]
MTETLRRTDLHDLHLELGGRMVPFAGYALPVQYAPGVMKEHLHCRAQAGLFDIGHMGQVVVRPRSGDVEDAARALEGLTPAAIVGLPEGRQRYAVLTADDGGILDDLMVARRADHLFLVVNASRKADDLAHLRDGLTDCDVIEVADRGLLALQGPLAEAALEALAPGAAAMRFMDVATLDSDFGDLWVSRSGYTGEDGFEISVQGGQAEALARALLARPGVAPIGLGARDSLRLEAGLCLYGNDIDATTTPVEANLLWSIPKVRRAGGSRAGGYPGVDVIERQIEEGPARLRVGLLPEGRAPMRAGTPLFAGQDDADPIGEITSGAFGPSLERPMAMGYVETGRTAVGTSLFAELRGRRLPVAVAELPFRAPTVKR